MRRAAMLLLVALLVGALPAAAVPISMFPEPFVKAGTIYTSDGKATMAIIIGDKAATFDMIGAAMLAMKIGSHLYYTNAPYVNVEDAAKHGITLYYGGFDSNVYNLQETRLTMVSPYMYDIWYDSGAGEVKQQRYSTPIINVTNGTAVNRALYYCYDKEYYRLYHKIRMYNNITGFIYDMGPGMLTRTITVNGIPVKTYIYCNPEPGLRTHRYDFLLMPLDQNMTPAVFHYILGEYVDDIKTMHDVLYPKIVTTNNGFYLQSGLVELENKTDVNIPWLGFKIHVDNINTTKNLIRMRLIAPDTGTTVAFLNVTQGDEYTGVSVSNKVLVVDDPNIYVRTVVKDPRTGQEIRITRWGVPYFKIANAIPMPAFGLILANFTSATFKTGAVTEDIAYIYGDFGAKARLSTVIYPVKGAWAVWNVSGDSNGWTYIWSKDVFPWFDGAVNAYFFNNTAIVRGEYKGDLYVFNKTYGIGTWNFNETKKIGCFEYLFSSIGNRTEVGAVPCPLSEKAPKALAYCTYICGDCAGVYRVQSVESQINKLRCPSNAFVSSEVSSYQYKATVYPREATGVFAGIFDRFENVTGFKGTTQLKIETSGNVTYAKDVTQPADVDQVFEGEAVFSFVKMPIIYLDSWVFVNNTLSDAVKDKDLILIGGPAVNSIVKYLNDAKLLDVTFTQVGGVWALSYAGKTYDLDYVLKILVDQGYLPSPISKEYVYRVEGGNGLGVIEYAKKNPFGSGNILVVAGTDRYGTLAASVALADPTKLASSTAPVFYAAGRGNVPNAVILLGIKPTAVPPPYVPAALTPVIVAIPAGAAG